MKNQKIENFNFFLIKTNQNISKIIWLINKKLRIQLSYYSQNFFADKDQLIFLKQIPKEILPKKLKDFTIVMLIKKEYSEKYFSEIKQNTDLLIIPLTDTKLTKKIIKNG